MRPCRHVIDVSRVFVAGALPSGRPLKCGEFQRRYCFKSPVLNHFQTFRLEPEYDIDSHVLTKKFRQLQTAHHPDKFVHKSTQEQKSASERSSFINLSYTVLKDPLSRSVHLLELAGYPLEENASDVGVEFLSDVMEINEQLAAVTNQQQLQAVKQKNQHILNSLYTSIADAFQQGNFLLAREIVYKLKYYTSVDAKVRNYEREHNIL